MRRADRLFRIVEYLKAHRQVVTAEKLAEVLEVSTRTIYRDIADLISLWFIPRSLLRFYLVPSLFREGSSNAPLLAAGFFLLTC